MALTVLIKPTGALCNLSCKYCFYTPEFHHSGIMDACDIDVLVNRLVEHEKNFLNIVFQGGEPLVAGIRWFEYFVNSLKHKITGEYSISIQTNATLINSAWCKFFKDNEILVGVSLDGNKYINDKCRVDSKGKTSFNDVMRAIKLLKTYRVEFNILAVITRYLCDNIETVLKFYERERFDYLQFTMPIREDYNIEVLPTNMQMYRFLNKTFEYYSQKISAKQYVSIRYFDNLINLYSNRPCEMCGVDGKCQAYLVIDSDGGCYPCDFYVVKDCYLGNIKNKSVNEILNNDTTVQFLNRAKLPTGCEECVVFDLCRGACPRYRQENAYYYCEAIKAFLIENREDIMQIAQYN